MPTEVGVEPVEDVRKKFVRRRRILIGSTALFAIGCIVFTHRVLTVAAEESRLAWEALPQEKKDRMLALEKEIGEDAPIGSFLIYGEPRHTQTIILGKSLGPMRRRIDNVGCLVGYGVTVLEKSSIQKIVGCSVVRIIIPNDPDWQSTAKSFILGLVGSD